MSNAKQIENMKTAKFRKTEMTMRSIGYGQYIIEATYRGKNVKVRTNDSETYDWLDDDSDRVRYNDARKSAYTLITIN
jgi:hypothetical protein